LRIVPRAALVLLYVRYAAIALLAIVLIGAGAGGAKHAHRTPVTISGTVLAINGDLAQFREDNGTTVTVDQHALIAAGQPLTLGGHFALHGYFNNNIFIARPNGSAYNDSGNAYPSPGSTTKVEGVVTSISGSRVTLMQGLYATITIDDQLALNSGTAQNLRVGTSITAYGYWSGSTFYATSIA
jgi:hypothetical protein